LPAYLFLSFLCQALPFIYHGAAKFSKTMVPAGCELKLYIYLAKQVNMTPHKFFSSRQAGTKKQKKSLPFCLRSINKTGVLSGKIKSEMKKRGPDERKNF
jgi:hypothetical protein